MLTEDRGSAVLESVFAMLFLVLLALGVTQVALSLYARNIVLSSAHEGARAAIELGRTEGEAVEIARRTVASATGRLVEDLEVGVRVVETGATRSVVVEVTGRMARVGPIPMPMRAHGRASASGEIEVP